jgi:hypothetical protein
MIPHPTEIKILKKYAPMTERGLKSQSASRRQQKSPAHGGRRIHAGSWLTAQSPEPYAMVPLFGFLAADAQVQSQSLTTKITKSLLRLCGFANRVTSSGTKS